jgi:hypothetical protein
VLPKQVAKGQDYGLIEGPISDQLDAGKTTDGGLLD